MKKGFTLIELLAVIVILAIIALIATPMILGVIDTAKQGAAKSAALGYIDAVEKKVMTSQLTATESAPAVKVTEGKEYTISNGTFTDDNSKTVTLDIKGDVPASGSVTFGKGGAVASVKNLEFKEVYSKTVSYVVSGNQFTFGS